MALAWLLIACMADDGETTDVRPLRPDTRGASSDCASAAPQSLCVPDDGEVLLYGAVPDPNVLNMQLFFSRPDRLGAVQLTPDGSRNPTDFNSYGARSPDRGTVAFVSGRDEPPSSGSVSRGLVYLAGADGSSQRRLSSAPAEGCQESMPRYAPDGEWLSFWRACSVDAVAESVEFMFRIHPDGTGEERLLDATRSGGDTALTWGTFSRDGATLYALEDAVVGEASGPSNILVAYDFASGAVTPIVDFLPEAGYVWGHPLELADGDLLYLYRNESSTPSIARLERVAPDGSGRTSVRDIPITASGAVQDFRFMINPAGDRLAYVHTESSTTTSLWVSAIDGSSATPVAPVAGTQFWLTWNP